MGRCGQCGAGFARNGKNAGKRWGRFCSQPCKDRASHKHWSKTMNYAELDRESRAVYHAWDTIVRNEDKDKCVT